MFQLKIGKPSLPLIPIGKKVLEIFSVGSDEDCIVKTLLSLKSKLACIFLVKLKFVLILKSFVY